MSTLDNLRKAAKRWLKALRANDPEARARLRRAYPDASDSPTLRDVQHALALEHGVESWIALKAKVATDERGMSDDPRATAITALLDAADQGDASRVIELLDSYPDIINERGLLPGHTGLRTALHFGIRHEPVVRALLERGADANIRDEGDNAMPLHFAAENQHLDIIRLLIEHGADPNAEGDWHELAVIGWASGWDYREADKKVVDLLIAHGARHNIFSAVAMGDVDSIRTLVAQSRANLDKRMDRTNRRHTPVHLAVVKKQQQSLAALLDLGADIEALDQARMTPLDRAALDGEPELAQLLIDRGAKMHLPAAIGLQRTDDIEKLRRDDPACLKPGHRYGNLIVRASSRSPGHIVETLIRLGASVDAQDDPETAVDGTGGYTPLHAAGFHGNAEAATVLLKHGAKVSVRDDRYCSTPAGWANYAGHRDVRDLILKGPIDIFEAIDFDLTHRIPPILRRDPEALNRPFRDYATCQPRSGQWWPGDWCTPLVWAVVKNNVEATKYLLEAGAHLTVAPDGRTLQDMANEKGREHVANVVRAHSGNPSPPAFDASLRAGRLDEKPGSHAERVARFLEFACWDHRVHGKGDHRMHDRAAQRILRQHPEITRDSLYPAIVCGDLDEVERILAERPEAARERGGARGWTPLLYLCYTRFSHQPAVDNAVAIARALLDRGADPNDYYMAGDARYSALVGVAREGEQDAPPHPRREELFQLLLERGAAMYDMQVLYNTHFSGDVLWWLELVYAHSVKRGRRSDWDDPDWSMLDMGGYGPGALFLLGIAVQKNDIRLAEWLLARGARANAANPKHPKFSPKHTLYAEAVRRGHSKIADLLLRHGATPVIPPLEGEEAFIDACLRLDREDVRRQLETHPEYLQSHKAMFAAARRDRPDVVEFLLELGVSIEIEDAHKQRPLHEAAGHGSLRVARLLVEGGAEIDPRETQWNATPIGFAAYGDRMAMVDFLSRYSKNVWTLAFRGYVDRLREVLQAEPDLAKVVAKDGTTPLWWLPDDEKKALEIVELFLKHGADPFKRSKEGTTAADWALKRGMLEVARRLAVADETQSPAP